MLAEPYLNRIRIGVRHMSYTRRFSFKIKPLAILFATTYIGAQLGQATPVLIDSFQTSQVNTTLTTAGAFSQTQATVGAEVIGGVRILNSYFISGPTGRKLDFQTEGAPLNDLTLNSQNGVTGSGLATYCGSTTCGTGTATFNGTIGSTTPTTFGLTGVDLTSAGTNTQIRIIGNSDQVVTIYATFYDTATSFARASFTIPGDILDHTYVLTFNNIGSDAPFTFSGGATSAIFGGGNTHAITFMIEGSDSSDTFISYFGADNVPEPATFGMLASGLGGLLWFARKRTSA